MINDITFIIVTWNAKDILLDCLTSLYKEVKDLNFEVFVVDNASSDDTVAAVKQNFPEAKVIENRKNLGFAAANNIVLKLITSRYAVLLNNDTIVLNGTFERLVQFMDEHQDVGAVGPQLLNKDGSKQNCFHNFPTIVSEIFGTSLLKLLLPKKYPGKRANFKTPIEVDGILGACLMIRKEAIDQIGPMDANYFFFLEETDYCFNLKKRGWKRYHVPDVKIIHLHGATSKKKSPAKTWIEFYRSNYRFFKKNRGYLCFVSVCFTKLLKLNINVTLMFILATVLGFKNKRYNQKLVTYATLLLWHYRFFHNDMGLSAANQKPEMRKKNSE